MHTLDSINIHAAARENIIKICVENSISLFNESSKQVYNVCAYIIFLHKLHFTSPEQTAPELRR